MPIFAIIVYAIVMVGSGEAPKFLDSPSAKKATGVVFVALFGGGIIVSLYYMIARFLELLANY